MTQVSWFLIERQYLLTWLFYQGHFFNYLVNPSIIQVITSFDAGKYLYDAGIYQWCAGFPLFAHTDWALFVYFYHKTQYKTHEITWRYLTRTSLKLATGGFSRANRTHYKMLSGATLFSFAKSIRSTSYSEQVFRKMLSFSAVKFLTDKKEIC